MRHQPSDSATQSPLDGGTSRYADEGRRAQLRSRDTITTYARDNTSYARNADNTNGGAMAARANGAMTAPAAAASQAGGMARSTSEMDRLMQQMSRVEWKVHSLEEQ